MEAMDFSVNITRRRFLRQTFAFSALAALGSAADLVHAGRASHGASELLMIGDWGYDKSDEAQRSVAAGMRRFVENHRLHTQALLMLGDNWYGALEGGAQSDRWQTHFETMYPKQVFDCPAYAILGNHDYQKWPSSKVEAELEYARTGTSRWKMPARWYRFEFPSQQPLITFLALDSNMPFADQKPAHGPNFTLTQAEQAEQLMWLETELRKPRTTPFLVVLGHHPVYSDGPHGDHPVLLRDWDPLFRRYHADLYLAGHDHDMQHLEFENHPTSFFLSGGGGADLYDLKVDPSARGPFARKVYGFSRLAVTQEKIQLWHLDPNGNVLHGFEKTREGKVSILS